MPEPPENFIYDPELKTLTWELVPGADEYWIQCTVINTDNWTDVYIGPETICSFQYPQGQYLVMGQAGNTRYLGLTWETTSN